MKRLALLLTLTIAGPCWSQSITLPPTLTVPKTGLVTIKPDKVDADAVAWVAVDDGLQLIDSSLLKDDKTAVGIALQPGSYRVRAVAARCVMGKAAFSAWSECLVTVGGVPPGPGPGPVPPTPGPNPPGPPAPIPAPGFRVLMIEDVAGRTKLNEAQLGALFNKSVVDYLNAHCAKGDDGRTPEWRRWDASTDPTGDEKHWAAALKLAPQDKGKLPWIIISDGKTGYIGPLPGNADDTLVLLKKYGEVK